MKKSSLPILTKKIKKISKDHMRLILGGDGNDEDKPVPPDNGGG